MFDDYTKALGARDWDEACEQLAPETTAKLRTSSRSASPTRRRTARA